jgi:hypothetical protein
MNRVNVDKTLNLYDGVKYNESESAIFDIDNDGIDDFEFKVFMSQSPGGYDYRSVEMITLDSSFQVSIDRIADTTFKTQVTYTYVMDGDTIVIIENKYFNTFYKPNLDSNAVVTIEDVYNRVFPYQYQPGSQLTANEEWEANKFILRSVNVSLGSTYSSHIFYDNWQFDKDQYILFKKGQGENARYGWFKVNLVDIDTLVIYEYAYQNLP